LVYLIIGTLIQAFALQFAYKNVKFVSKASFRHFMRFFNLFFYRKKLQLNEPKPLRPKSSPTSAKRWHDRNSMIAFYGKRWEHKLAKKYNFCMGLNSPPTQKAFRAILSVRNIFFRRIFSSIELYIRVKSEKLHGFFFSSVTLTRPYWPTVNRKGKTCF